MKRGDVYLVTLDPAEGRQQKGKRPVVIVSATEFNEASKLPVVCPITSISDFARRIGFAVEITGSSTTGFVRCDRPRVLDLAVRRGRRVGSLPDEVMQEVLARVVALFEV